MTNAIAAYARQTIRDTTALGMDYSMDELDDLGSRKQEVPVSGDDLARQVRARRGTARATGQADPHPLYREDRAAASIWGPDAMPRVWLGGNRRMAAVGRIDPAWGTLGWGEEYVNQDGDVFRWYPLDNDGGPTIVRGPNY